MRLAAPRLLLLANLFRDQLDRYGELELIADRWAELVAGSPAGTRFVLNADDPLIADLGRGRPGVVYFGLEDDLQAHCPRCSTQRTPSAVATAARPTTTPRSTWGTSALLLPALRTRAPAARYRRGGCIWRVSGSRIELRTPQGELSLRLPVPGLYNVYNAGGCDTALTLDVAPATIVESLELAGAFGRVETIVVRGRGVSILREEPGGHERGPATLALENGR